MSEALVAVVGMGLLGRGIAACLLASGYRVLGYDRSTVSLQKGAAAIDAAINELCEQGLPDVSIRQSWTSAYRESATLADLGEASFVIESIVEDADAKRRLFDDLERVVERTTPIASNTSAIPISALMTDRLHPERFLGMHWAEPAHATRFLELIRGAATSDEAFARAVALAEHCGKEPSFVERDVPGFIANRLGYAMYREALHLLEAGVADAETIDRSFRNSVGLWATFCGPLRWIDLTGGPTLYAKAMAPVLPDLANDSTIPATIADLAAANAEGIINGRGFYQYEHDEGEFWEMQFRSHAWNIKRLVDQERPLDPPA